jgi:hypothetical protein
MLPGEARGKVRGGILVRVGLNHSSPVTYVRLRIIQHEHKRRVETRTACDLLNPLDLFHNFSP